MMLFSATEDGNYSTFKNIIAPVLSFVFALLDVHIFLFKLLTALVYGIYVINYIDKLHNTWGYYVFSPMTD